MRLSAGEPLRRSFRVGTFAGRNQAGDLERLTRPREFYFYNTPAEVDRFVEVMNEIQKFFGQ
jgi:selenocysteine lyase/cysteine desulfurase